MLWHGREEVLTLDAEEGTLWAWGTRNEARPHLLSEKTDWVHVVDCDRVMAVDSTADGTESAGSLHRIADKGHLWEWRTASSGDCGGDSRAIRQATRPRITRLHVDFTLKVFCTSEFKDDLAALWSKGRCELRRRSEGNVWAGM